MSYVPLETLLDKSEGSIYKLVILASRRALEIAEGAAKLKTMAADTKPTIVALAEISDGAVQYKKAKKGK
jgi:DNA-directed RNA polymerase omega subunit